MHANPLLTPSTLKHSAVPFDQIKDEHFLPALEHTIRLGYERLTELKAKPASFENTLRGLEIATEEMEFVYSVFTNLLLANTNERLQALSTEMGPRVAAFANDILLDPVVFAKVREVYDERKSLDKEQAWLAEKTFLDFQRSGAGLSDDKKARLRELDQTLSRLHPRFRENVLKAANKFELWITNEADLDGLTPTLKEAAKVAATERGRGDAWLITLQHPSFFPFLHFAKNRTLREQVYRANLGRALGGEFDNQALVRQIVSLMHEKARLLGFATYADYALQTRMAETPATVSAFLKRLITAVKPVAKRELGELRELSVKTGGPAELMPWDLWYYMERARETRYDFDQEQLRPYFKLENVLNGVFELAGRLYGLKFTPTKAYPAYHEDVQVFEVTQERDGQQFIGLFYADFFPRASKNQGAWMTNFYEQGHFRGRKGRPHVSIVCNFTKPTADKPSLLTFDEVSTLFHEFGHALHSLLSQVEYRTFAGTNVYLDFVELPSQIFENWAEEEESLRLFARHYQTGAPIPPELIARLKASQLFAVGLNGLRQLNFATLDMAWFTTPPAETESVTDFENRVTADTQVFPPVAGTNVSVGFNHIFGGGYASGYYSYKWAEALDADAFELFKEQGIFNPEVARRFETMLSKGGSDHPMRLYEQFRGRSPDPEALLRRDGIVS